MVLKPKKSLKTAKASKKSKTTMLEPEAFDEPEYDESVYEFLLNFTPKTSCLSFNIIPDNINTINEINYPLTTYMVTGTQNPIVNKNSIIVLKLSNIHSSSQSQKSNPDSDSDSSSSDDESTSDKKSNSIFSYEPKFQSAVIQHRGAINRLKYNQIDENALVATWSETKSIHIWNLNAALISINDERYSYTYRKELISNKNNAPSKSNDDTNQLSLFRSKPIQTFSGHLEEGFALDWSTVKKGRLATGDNKGHIHVWDLLENTTSWKVDQIPYVSHKSSVEDIQWSPSEPEVFASCSSDCSIKIWDCRATRPNAAMLTNGQAHETDINVIGWNRIEQYFLVSGADDGSIKVWDLREFKENRPIAEFRYHSGAITSIEWKPDESSVFAASSADDKLTVWDLSLERDEQTLLQTCREKQKETQKLINNCDDVEDKNIENSLNQHNALKTQVDKEIEELKTLDSEIPPYLLFVHEGQKEIKELHWHPQIPGLIIDTALTGINLFKTINV